MPSTTPKVTHEVALASVLAAFVGVDAAYLAAVEFALTESANGHFSCAREALRSVPDAHLRRAITGAAVLSRLATDMLTDRAQLVEDRAGDSR